ncbi:hypothetical protein [Streptomyces sp. NPDC004065]|uniref:hypothetical protein n=1 Tax=Streptomyces sp. NPDC004065 TaxID=3364689 RepID=UPI00384F5997
MPGPPPTPRPSGETTELVTLMVDELARRLAPEAVRAAAEVPDPPGDARRRALARLQVLVGIKQAVRHLEDQAARAAAADGAGYPEIGRAASMSRQGARRRWPGLITNSTPRPPYRPTPRSS